MRVLEKDAADPVLHRKGEHVPAVAGRPVRNGESGLMARHKSTEKEQEKAARGRKESEVVKPARSWVVRRSDVHSAVRETSEVTP